MNKREKVLALGVLALAVVWGGRSLFLKYRSTLEARRSLVGNAETELADVNLALAKGRDAVRQMERLQERSLPADKEKALSLYKAWLLEKAKTAGLTVNDIKLAPRTSASTSFEAIGYQLDASGTLSSLVGMMYEFYTSPQLHQITRLRLLRPPGATQLQITLEVEALCLRGAVATDNLPTGKSKRLKHSSLADYQKSLGERDMVTVYTPPRPPAPPPAPRPDTPPPAPPKFDDSEFAMFSGAVDTGNGPQAWIHVRTTGETLHLSAGDPVKIGVLEGIIETIDSRSLVLKTGDKKFRVPLGESLRKGKELDANGNPRPAEEEETKT
ncbi:MAG: hypothetical protein IT425_07715 [Pirellulales bacterium]|nr:hypothetical protein [Pirellulales bacterium]